MEGLVSHPPNALPDRFIGNQVVTRDDGRDVRDDVLRTGVCKQSTEPKWGTKCLASFCLTTGVVAGKQTNMDVGDGSANTRTNRNTFQDNTGHFVSSRTFRLLGVRDHRLHNPSRYLVDLGRFLVWLHLYLGFVL